MSLKRFAKDTAIYGVATILPRIVSVLLTRLFTGEMDTSEFSVATDFWVYAAFFNVILTYGMETSFFRFFTKHNKDEKVVNTSFTIILLTSITFLIVVLLFRVPISAFLGIKVIYFTILTWVTILDTIVVVPFAFLRVTNRPIRFAFIKIANIFIYLIIVLLGFKIVENSNTFQWISQLSDNKVIYIFIANLVASGITLIMFVKLFSKIRFSIDKKLLNEMLIYGYPIMIAGLAYVINENLDKLLLKRMLSADIMGSYAATYKVGTFMSLYITAFRLGAEPFFFSHSEQKDAKEKYATILLWFTIVGAVFLLFIIANLDLIYRFFIRQEEYFKTLAIVPIILVANLFLGLYHNLSVWYKLTDKTRYGMYFSIFGAIITIVLNLVFIPIYGFITSAWVTLLAYGCMAIISYFYGRKYYSVPYNIRKISIYLLTSIILSFVIFYFSYDKLLINNGVFAIFLVFIYISERKSIIGFVKR